MKKCNPTNSRFLIARTVIVLSVLLSLASTSLAAPPHNPLEPTRAMRYCTDAGVTYYCLLNLQGNTINGKSCSFGDVNKNNGQAIEGGDQRELFSCLNFCSDWVCYYIKDQQESSGKPVTGSPCCNSNSSGWKTTR